MDRIPIFNAIRGRRLFSLKMSMGLNLGFANSSIIYVQSDTQNVAITYTIILDLYVLKMIYDKISCLAVIQTINNMCY